MSHYEKYRAAIRLSQTTEPVQINNSLLHMGLEVNKLLDILGLKENSYKTYEEFKEAFSNYYVLRRVKFTFAGEVTISQVTKQCPPLIMKLQVGKQILNFKIDTGADESIMSENDFKSLNEIQFEKTLCKLFGPGKGGARQL